MRDSYIEKPRQYGIRRIWRELLVPYIYSVLKQRRTCQRRVYVQESQLSFPFKVEMGAVPRLPIVNTKALRLLGVYEPETARFLRKVLKPGARVLEVGAAYGYFTVQSSLLVGKEGEVVSIEPNPEMFSNLKENVSLNQIKNVKLIDCALVPDGYEEEFEKNFQQISVSNVLTQRADTKSYFDLVFIDVDANGPGGVEIRQEEALIRQLLKIFNRASRRPDFFVEYIECAGALEEIFARNSYECDTVTSRHFHFYPKGTKDKIRA